MSDFMLLHSVKRINLFPQCYPDMDLAGSMPPLVTVSAFEDKTDSDVVMNEASSTTTSGRRGLAV